MTIQRFFLLMFSFLLFAPFAQAQKGKDQVKQTTENHHTDQHQHTHQDSSYHCGLCASYLFDADEVTTINNTELHYHGIGTDGTKSPFHCAACKSHLGYFNHKHNNYEVLNKNLDKKDTGIFHCSACEMPCLLYTSPSPRDQRGPRMPSSA